ncbi:MAG: caspase family protein [Planctomycetes bacterium]|nr:caspase family protein [Planctomycetota bacterium]
MARRVAILIASSRFPDEPGLTTLDAPERDVDELRAVLAGDQGGVFDDVLVLKNEPSQKVRVQLNRSLRAAAKDDQVLIYFSGHGKLDPTGRLCLTMTDTVLDALESSALRIGELKDFLDVSRCKNVMLFLDCCYSGAVGKSFTRGAVDDQLQIAAEGAGICIMSASNSVQTAMETPESGLGVFTRNVIEGIRTGAADVDGDGLVTFDELYDYVHARVSAEGHQRPQKWSFQAEGELLIARTGRDAWEESRKKIRAKILALAENQDLPDEVVADALELLNVAPKERGDKQRLQVKLLEEFAVAGAKPTAFVMAWMKLVAAPETPRVVEAPPPVVVEAPPAALPSKLSTWPVERIDFGRRVRGQTPQEQLKVWSDGPGRFHWSVETEGDFFEVDRNDEGVVVTLVDAEPGQKEGSITVRSNVGEVKLAVRARIVESKPVPSPSTPLSPQFVAPPHVLQPKFTPGRWQIELKALGIQGAKYTLDCFPNGAIQGGSTVWGVNSQIAGTWGYDIPNEVLVLQLMQNTFGIQSGDTLTIHVTEQDGNVLKGRDAMRTFTLTKLGVG